MSGYKVYASEQFVEEKIANIKIPEQVQVDFNQNDETAPDYIKNRPFYEEIFEGVLLEETEVTAAAVDEGGTIFVDPTSVALPVITTGDSYTITFNGTQYECIAHDFSGEFSGIPFIGNSSLLGIPTDNMNEPFLFVYNGDFTIMVTETAGTHTLKIEGKLSTVHEIDEKFISCKPGLNVEGKEFIIDEETLVAKKGSEIFNDYLNNKAIGKYSHAEGAGTNAIGDYSHTEGNETIASGTHSHAEGFFSRASGEGSHAEGTSEAIGNYSHAEGSSIASGEDSHAEGTSTQASGKSSHAEGAGTTASGNYSHAEGYGANVSGDYSHAEGNETIASGRYQHVQGKYNIEDTANKYAHIVGNGTYSNRSNAHTIDWDGNAWYAGDVYTGGTGQDDTTAKKLITVDNIFDGVLFKDSLTGVTYVGYVYDGNWVLAKKLTGIEITTLPEKRGYIEGDIIDLTGMVVSATFEDGTKAEITEYEYNKDTLKYGENEFVITHRQAGVVYSQSFDITVTSFAEAALIDFVYTDNGDGTYTITDWKGTYQGEASTKCIIPRSKLIKLQLD